MGIRFPPLAHPSSSTRAVSMAGGVIPNTVATVASTSGCDCANARCGYGNTSKLLIASGLLPELLLLLAGIGVAAMGGSTQARRDERYGGNINAARDPTGGGVGSLHGRDRR